MRISLKPLKDGKERKNEFAVCDIESTKWTNFLCIGYYNGKNYEVFKDLDKFLKYVFCNGPRVVYAHFGGKFDFLFILSECLYRGYSIGPIIPRGSGILSFDVSDGTHSIEFRDCSAFLPFALKTLTTNFNVAHKKQEIDYEKITKVTKKLLEYLEYDCKGLYECIEKYHTWDLIKRAGSSHTIASQAMRVLRLFIKKPIYYLDYFLDKDIRPAYLGGRVEVFKPVFRSNSRHTYLYCYDVNSLYPTVMRENHYPNAFSHCTDYWEPKKIGFYRAKVCVPEMYLPPLGIVRAGKYIFPTGEFEGYWTIAELNYAKSLGVKIEPKEGWIFGDGGYIFKDFVDELYKIKEKSSPQSVDYVMSKLLMNSCYGRFGIKSDRQNIVFDDGSNGLCPLEDDTWLRVGKNKYRLMLKDVKLDTFSNVAIASYVTSYARIMMHSIMMKTRDEIYYTDTDSMFTTKKFPTGTGLGKLKLEYKVKSACFLLPKTYIAGDKVVMKGFDRKKIKEFTFEDFMDCLEGESRLKIVQEPRFATFKTALKQGKLVTMTKGNTRQLRALYDKRIIVKVGNTYDTKPINIEREKK